VNYLGIKRDRGKWSQAAIWGALAWMLLAFQAAALDPQKSITQFYHRAWGNAEGIEQVNAIAQTKDGYFWIATINGLFRFDGVTCVPWEPNPGGAALPGVPFQLLNVRNGDLWVGGTGALTLIRDGNSKVFVVRNSEGRAMVFGLCEGGDGVVWAATSLGLYRFSGLEWTRLGPDSGLPNGRVTAVMCDSENTLWLATDDGKQNSPSAIAYLRKGEQKFRVGSPRAEVSFKLAQAPDGKIWTAQTTKSVACFTYDGTDIQYVPPEIHVGSQALHFDRHGGLWIPTLGDGVRRIRNTAQLGAEDIGQFSERADKFGQKEGLSGDYVNCVFEDREGAIWFGTSAGLDCFSETKITSLSAREGLPFDQNLAVGASPDGSIWAGSEPHGFFQIDTSSGQFINRGWLDLLGKAPGSRSMYSFYADRAGNLILGMGLGVAVLRTNDNQATLLPQVPDLRTVLAITGDLFGGLWLCDRNLGVYRLFDGKAQHFPELHREGDGWVAAAHTDRNGRVWLGLTTGEVALYEADKFRVFNSANGLFAGQISAILSDTKAGVWAAGKGGISRYRDGRFQRLDRGNGLPFDEIFAAIQDDDGYFWLAGAMGICRVAEAELETALAAASHRITCEVFDLKDGLRGVVRHTPYGLRGNAYSVATKATDGKLWFATTTGLALIDPRHLPRNPLAPPVRVQRIIARGNNYAAAAKLRLPVGIRDCEIDYAGLSSGKVHYRYKLEGYDKEWTEAGSRRQAFYSNLRPHTYKFRVSAGNSDGIWNEAGDALEFTIPPAYYETTWFYLLCGAVIAAGAAGGYAWRIRQLHSRHQALQKASELLQTANVKLSNEIEERKRAQEAMRAARARFEGILEIAEDAIISVDASQRIVLFNQGAQAVFGYKEREVIGEQLHLLLPERFAHAHRSHLAAFAGSAEISRSMAQRQEVFGRRKDGSEFPAEASISKLDLGQEMVFTVILRDITVRKRLENRLRQSERNLAEGQRLTKTGSWILDFNTGNTDWSVETCRIFGFPDPPPSPHYRDFRARVRPEDREAVDRGLRESFETGEPRPLKYIFVLPDGHRKNIETISQPVRDETGKIVRLMGTVMDVTERAQAAEALRASEHLARGQFAALTRSLDLLAQETDPDKLPKHVVTALLTQMNAHSAAIWERNGEVLDLLGIIDEEQFVTNSKAAGGKGNLPAIGPAPPLWCEGLEAGNHLVIEDADQEPCRIRLGDGRSAVWPEAGLPAVFARKQGHFRAPGSRVLLISPMLMSGQLAGLIAIRFSGPRAFGSDEIELTKALAHQAMLSIQLMRLSQQSRQAAVMAERNRMARDIHDTLAQGFTGVIMQLEAAKGATTQGDLAEAETRIERAGELARTSLGEARRSVRALRPRSLRNGKLFATLDNLFRQMTEGADLNAEFRAEGDERAIPAEYEDALLRITQESLTNAIKHANARNFKATLGVSENKIQLQLADDGCGFDPRAAHEGFGLIGMKERVEQMNGEFLLRSTPGIGTEIFVVFKQHAAPKPENANE